MERACPICQTAIHDDQLTMCPTCGADVPSAESTRELDLGELENGDLANGLGKLAEGKWETGAVGGEAGYEAEEEEAEETPGPEKPAEEEVELGENEFICPSCESIVETGTAECPVCATSTEYLVPCPSCGFGIDRVAEICPHCYAELLKKEAPKPEPAPKPAKAPRPEPAVKPMKAANGKPVEELSEEELTALEEGENGELSEKDKKRMLKKLQKDQKRLEKELEKGKITEEEFEKRLDEIRMGNGFGPIGGFVLDEEETSKKEEAELPDKREARAMRKERMKEIMAEERSKSVFNYYNLSLITLFFFVFLAIFVLFEFIFSVANVTSQTSVPRAFFSLAPTLGNVATVPVLMFALIITMFDAVLHLWDRRLNLALSVFVVTPIMIGSLAVDFFYESQFVRTDWLMIIAMLFLLLFMVCLDGYCLINYPAVLSAQSRDELELYLEKEEEMREIQQQLEDEYQRMIEEEEEKLKMKDDEMDEIKQELENLSDMIQQEEEKLRLKEEEISAIKSELEVRNQELMEEEEKLKMKEEEMESLIQTELEKRAEDMFIEEEEKLRMKEEELIKSRNELEIQKNLFDETREKLRMKEQEMMSLRTELENQMRIRMEEEDRLRLKEAAAKMLERGKQKRVLFPFAAMVGQERMKRSLVLNAVYPEVGGVLIRGQKGTGKSVSVRGLAEVLPDIDVTGCKFNCDPSEPDKFCTECAAKHKAGKLETYSRPVQVVDLPLNITEDRLVGSIDIEKILTEGVKSFEPGILAEAHRGILYVDEINLLDDYIVDILLDAASSGTVTIEREGLSISHPARFIIVGSMNPEEGELRPQILDRLALQCDVVGIKDVQQRIDIVKRREEFTADPDGFRQKYEGAKQELRDRVNKARELIPNVTTPPRIFKLIAQICLDFDVDGHRADIIIERAARANAAFEGRLETTAEDITVAASMALPHRMRRRPTDEEEFSEETIRKIVKQREAELED